MLDRVGLWVPRVLRVVRALAVRISSWCTIGLSFHPREEPSHSPCEAHPDIRFMVQILLEFMEYIGDMAAHGVVVLVTRSDEATYHKPLP